MSPRRHGPAAPFARFARLFSSQAPAGRTRRRPRSLHGLHGLRLESLESRAMLSSMPFIATLPDDLASRTASLFTVHGRYGNNALNGDCVDGGRKRRRGDRVAAVQNGGAQPCRSLGGDDRGDSPDHTPFQREAQECTATWRFGARFAVRC